VVIVISGVPVKGGGITGGGVGSVSFEHDPSVIKNKDVISSTKTPLFKVEILDIFNFFLGLTTEDVHCL
jgi:hypothetical protein